MKYGLEIGDLFYVRGSSDLPEFDRIIMVVGFYDFIDCFGEHEELIRCFDFAYNYVREIGFKSLTFTKMVKII